MESVTFRQGTTVRLTTAKAYDTLNRLTSIDSVSSASSASSAGFGYSYNAAQQRTRVDLADGSYWLYAYDTLGQVISGKKYWSDNSPVAGQAFDYTFDSIGNRTSASRYTEGNSILAALSFPTVTDQQLRTTTYTVNGLNQATGRTVPGFVDVLGMAAPNATVTVNGQSTARKGGYFHAEVMVNNSGAPQFATLDTTATFGAASKTETGKQFLPQNPESYWHDGNGNLMQDGRWWYTWDGENRLVEMQTRNDVPDAAKQKLTFAYDAQSRRIRKVVYTWRRAPEWGICREHRVLDSLNRCGLHAQDNNIMGRNLLLTSLLLGFCFLPACSGGDVHGCYSVEIAPGKFVPVKFSKWFPRDMTIQYSNQIVKWTRHVEVNSPSSLMEFDGKLYLLALDAKRKRPRNEWLYRCYRQEGETFKEIPAKDFPRSIAIFNVWRPGDLSRFSTGIGGVIIDDAKLGRELNPEDKYFVNSYQARLCYMLEVENNLYKAEREFGGEAAQQFLREYIAKYKPARLTSMEMKPVPKEECKF